MGMVEFVDSILGIPEICLRTRRWFFVDHMEKRENVSERESLCWDSLLFELDLKWSGTTRWI